MTIYVTDTTSKEKTIIPMLPDEIYFNAAANFLTYDIMDIGEMKLPKGAALTTLSWDAIFPGKVIKSAPYVQGTWQQPDNYVRLFDRYKYQGTPLQIEATNSSINMPVYVSEFDVTFKASYGWDYSITFVQRKTIQVTTVSSTATAGSTAAKSASKSTAATRTVTSTKTYTVKKGDSLWKIAEKYLGAGSRYMEIYNANKSKLKNSNTIYPGQILNIP
jgi:LysM repeat protein